MQPGGQDVPLVEAAAGYVLNYFRAHPGATFDQAFTYAEGKLGIAIVGELDLQITQAVTQALAQPGIIAAAGGNPTLQQLFPGLPQGTEVELRFLVNQRDAQGKIVWARTLLVNVTIGADTFAAAENIARQYIAGQEWTPPDPVNAPAPDFEFQPTLPFPASQ